MIAPIICSGVNRFLLNNSVSPCKRAQVFTIASSRLLLEKSRGNPLDDLGSFLHNSRHQILYRGQIFYSLSTFTTCNEHFFFVPSIGGIHTFDLMTDQLYRTFTQHFIRSAEKHTR